jgi:starvation-inducible outer membrane lipoprotein
MKSKADSSVSFTALLRSPDAYQGKTLVLGGYVMNVWTGKDETTIAVVQAPLGFRDRPKSKKLSEGRFIVKYKGFLEPPQSWRGIGITVAGEVAGLTKETYSQCPEPCLKVMGREIHFLPEYHYTDSGSSTDGYVPRSSEFGVRGTAGPLFRDPWYDPGNAGAVGQPRDFSW